jgi:hypothetical protein
MCTMRYQYRPTCLFLFSSDVALLVAGAHADISSTINATPKSTTCTRPLVHLNIFYSQFLLSGGGYYSVHNTTHPTAALSTSLAPARAAQLRQPIGSRRWLRRVGRRRCKHCTCDPFVRARASAHGEYQCDWIRLMPVDGEEGGRRNTRGEPCLACAQQGRPVATAAAHDLLSHYTGLNLASKLKQEYVD